MFHSYSLDKRAIPINAVVTTVQSASLLGFSVQQVLVDTGISETDLQDSEQRVSYRQRIQQLNNVISLADDPGFWLDQETEVAISDYGLLGYAMMSSATLAQAVQIAVKYHKMAGAMFPTERLLVPLQSTRNI